MKGFSLAKISNTERTYIVRIARITQGLAHRITSLDSGAGRLTIATHRDRSTDLLVVTLP